MRERLEMCSGGELRDDAAEASLERDLGGEGLTEDLAAILDEGDAGLVGGGLEGEGDHGAVQTTTPGRGRIQPCRYMKSPRRLQAGSTFSTRRSSLRPGSSRLSGPCSRLRPGGGRDAS